MKIRFTARALADLDDILSYIKARSPAGAKRVKTRILSVINLLRRFPKIGTPSDDAKTRMLVAMPYPYLVFYEIDDLSQEAVILHVRHGARDRNG